MYKLAISSNFYDVWVFDDFIHENPQKFAIQYIFYFETHKLVVDHQIKNSLMPTFLSLLHVQLRQKSKMNIDISLAHVNYESVKFILLKGHLFGQQENIVYGHTSHSFNIIGCLSKPRVLPTPFLHFSIHDEYTSWFHLQPIFYIREQTKYVVHQITKILCNLEAIFLT